MQTEDLRKRADNWVAAELRGGAAFLEDTLTDDFAGVGPRGVVLNWEQRPAPWVEGSTRLDYRPFALDRSEVRLYGGAAVATGRQTQACERPSHDVGRQWRTTPISAERDGRCLLAGWHASSIATMLPNGSSHDVRRLAIGAAALLGHSRLPQGGNTC